jgi:hypothetical protein
VRGQLRVWLGIRPRGCGAWAPMGHAHEVCVWNSMKLITCCAVRPFITAKEHIHEPSRFFSCMQHPADLQGACTWQLLLPPKNKASAGSNEQPFRRCSTGAQAPRTHTGSEHVCAACTPAGSLQVRGPGRHARRRSHALPYSTALTQLCVGP